MIREELDNGPRYQDGFAGDTRFRDGNDQDQRPRERQETTHGMASRKHYKHWLRYVFDQKGHSQTLKEIPPFSEKKDWEHFKYKVTLCLTSLGISSYLYDRPNEDDLIEMRNDEIILIWSIVKGIISEAYCNLGLEVLPVFLFQERWNLLQGLALISRHRILRSSRRREGKKQSPKIHQDVP
jgi:hypothetical protein